MKRTLSLLTLLFLFLSLPLLPAMAEESDTVTVTIANGSLCYHGTVELTDLDTDGTLSIHDALLAAHIAAGRESDYLASPTEYGLSLMKLWGVENGGAYGYCVNNASAMSLLDAVRAGDHVYAYVYTDLTAYSDAFAYFDRSHVTVTSGEKTTLSLSVMSYDEQFRPVTAPLVGATVLVDGKDSGALTDKDGRVTLSLSLTEGQRVTVSASCADRVITPPVCVLEGVGNPATGDDTTTYLIIAAAALGVAILVLFLLPRNKRK